MVGLGYRQSVQAQEDKLLSSLAKIYRRIQIDLKNGATWSEIQTIYHNRTDDVIRASVTTIYELAARKTAERDIKIPFFLTQRDLTEIRRLSQKYQESFWLALDREINMHSTIGVKSHYDPKTLLLIREEDTRLRQGFIGRIAQSIHGEVAAVGVVSKARQVVLQHNVATMIKTLQAATRTRGGAEQVLSRARLVWKTDIHPCQQCEALHNTAFSLDDPDTPIPSFDTHPRCKCELVLQDASLSDESISEASEVFF